MDSSDRILLVVRLTRPLDRRLIVEALERAGCELEDLRMAGEHELVQA